MTTVEDLLHEYKELPAAESTAPVLTLTEKNGFVRQADRFHKRLATEDISKYKVVRKNDIAFNPYLLWAGAVAQNNLVDEGIISPLYPTFKVRDGHDPRYIARLLLTPQMIAAYDTIAFGSVPRRRRSSTRDFLDLKTPTPPKLDQQRRIAAILDHADALCQKYRSLIVHLDQLGQAEFKELVGVERPTTPLGEVAHFYGGTTLPDGVRFQSQSGGFLLMKVSDMNAPGNEERIVTCKLWSAEQGPTAATCPAGAVVLPKRGAAIATNKKRITTRPTILDPNLMGIAPRENRATATFLLYWFKQFDLTSITSGSTVPQLNKRDLEPLAFPDVSPAEQRSFKERLAVIDSQSALVRRAQIQADGLFASLQSRAFSGRL